MNQFQPSQYSNYGADEDSYGGSLWSGTNYLYYRALGYSAEEAAIKTFEYQEGRDATAVEKAQIAGGWSGEGAQLPASVVEQAIQEERAKEPYHPPQTQTQPQPRTQTQPQPQDDGKKPPITEEPWFWPVLITGAFGIIGGVIWFWPKGKPVPLIGKKNPLYVNHVYWYKDGGLELIDEDVIGSDLELITYLTSDDDEDEELFEPSSMPGVRIGVSRYRDGTPVLSLIYPPRDRPR